MLNSFWSSLFSSKKATSNTGKSKLYGPPAPPYSTAPQSYQIKQGDTLGSIAKQYGLSETQLQGINNVLVAPPRGSFIDLTPPKVPQYGPEPQYGPQQQPNYQAPPPTSTAYAQGNAPKTTTTGTTTGYDLGGYDYKFTAGGRHYDPYGGVMQTATQYKTQFDQAIKNYQLTGQQDNSNLPDTIGLQVQEALGFAAQDMIDFGYTYNQNGLWVKGVNATRPSGQLAPGVTVKTASGQYVQGGQAAGVTYTWVFRNGKWKQIRQGSRKQKRGDVGNSASPERLSNEATVAPVTTLDVRLGSG